MINMMTAMSVSKSYCHKEIQIAVSQLDKPFLIDRANLASFKSIVDAKIIRIFLNINIFFRIYGESSLSISNISVTKTC